MEQSAEDLKNHGNARMAAGDLAGAVASYRRALAVAPGHLPSLYNLGLALRELGDFEQAEACFRRVVSSDASDADALLHLGTLLHRRMQLTEAEDAYRRALGTAPDNPYLWMALGEVGVARFTGASLREAAACFRRAIELRPGIAEAHHWLGHVHGFDGRRDEALRCYEEALRLQPEAPAFRAHLLAEMLQHCDWSRLDELIRLQLRSVLEQPEQPFDPFTLLLLASTPQEQLACARNFSRSIGRGVALERGATGSRIDRLSRRRRIGYLSAEFHAHATAYLSAELFELHDRDRFEVIAYSYGPDDGSAIRARLRQGFDRFVDLRSLPHAAAAAAIRADGVDLLVDMKGYTAHARPEILALRPAPVQVNFLGYPGSMGAGFIDYLIGDRFVTPAAHAERYDEKLVLMPDSYQVNDRQRAVGATPGRARLGLPGDGFVFCCFSQSYKIMPEVFAAWMRMLTAVPDSVLWLLDWNQWATRNLRQEASRLGVDPVRLLFGPILPVEAHLGRMRAADLFLDTFPVNAHTTASEALWAGLPLLTCAGESFVSRVAGSLLTAAGLPQLIARSLAEYEALGLRLARAPGELAAVREHLDRDRAALPLFDSPRYARHLEAAYEAMWRNYVAGGAPQQIEL